VFSLCTSLTAISLETNNPAYSSVDGVLFDKSQTTLIEYPGGKVGSYSIPKTVTSIEGGAFSGCTSLTSVTIPNSVTSIGDGAFESCTTLTNITIPNSVTSIAEQMFSSCFSLTSVTIPDSVTSIGDGAFIGCTNLTSVTIPNSVTTIGLAFQFCSSLRAISVEINNPAYSSVDGVLFDKSQTTLIRYPAGNVASSYSIPNTVTSIERNAFWGCTSLTSVTIPNSVTEIGAYAFCSCTNLTSVTIPNNVTSIGYETFGRCSGLTNVTIGNSVTEIGDYAFYSCTSLTSVTIPNSVTSFGWLDGPTFSGCTNLARVYFQGNTPYGFLGIGLNDNATVYYLPGTTGWRSTFEGIPTALWSLPYPLILNSSLGVRSNQFSFTVSWATNLSIVVEASTDLSKNTWTPLQSNALNNGVVNFTDPEWTKYPSRFYRVRSQ
jgi:hypothetical protein